MAALHARNYGIPRHRQDPNAHQRRCIRYSCMDARRLANRRGLTVRGPQKIFDSSVAAIGMLYAQRHDVFGKYYALFFERFWKRALDIENREAIRAALAEAHAPVPDFPDFLDGDGRLAKTRRIRAFYRSRCRIGVTEPPRLSTSISREGTMSAVDTKRSAADYAALTRVVATGTTRAPALRVVK